MKNVLDFQNNKATGEPISMVTSYDTWSAKIINDTQIDCILVGDSASMGHLGLTPQSVHQHGGFKVQGKGEEAAKQILDDALSLEQVGCFSIVLECIPAPLAGEITNNLSIPTIGIGSGPDTSGQVLVLQDLLGMDPSFQPKFVRRYLDGFHLIKHALDDFDSDVKAKSFPVKKESFV